ncbi:hypothetical protein F444_19633 [Phytophthora nicotianae P1976]|uniref:Uncharacterized protein n=1 Tax=Phytophthora nicotianae P1976 TaxID=1317066 RepID=A0A080Z740_PHYNI|nr:hypothetical protein F444_19633 [Phytophthora nicotianae P1976]
MLRQLPPPLPPLSSSQDVAATQFSACDSSAVTPSECGEDSQRLRPVKSEQHLSPAKTTFVETRADYKFFVKGHTKNACDCGFGHIRKHVSRQDCWTTDHIISAVNNSATSNTTVHISRGNVFFKSFKPVVTELYKNLTSVQQYQVLSMVKDQPGVVLCRKGPGNEATRQDLRRSVDGVATEDIKVDRTFTHFLEDLSPPPLNSENQC